MFFLPTQACFSVEIIDAVTVATFARDMDVGETVAAARELAQLVAEGAKNVVLDCAHINRYCQNLFGRLILLPKNDGREPVRWVLCNIKPHICDYLAHSGQKSYLTIVSDRQSALARCRS